MFFKKDASPAVTAPTPDFLQKKQDAVDRLVYQTNLAVDVVRQTIGQLESVNQQIDKDLEEIDTYTKALCAARASMDQQRKHNTTVIANFAKLLDSDTEDS